MSDREPTSIYTKRAAYRANREVAITPEGIGFLSNPDPNKETNLGGKILSLYEEGEKIKDENIRDPSTGLFNRRYFDRFMNNLRPTDIVGVAIVDIDKFKEVNDQFGHPAGDSLLRGVARILNDSVREERINKKENDLVARLGGDEMAIVFRGNTLNLDELQTKCQNIVNKVSVNLFWVSTGTKINKTISIGLGIRQTGENQVN